VFQNISLFSLHILLVTGASVCSENIMSLSLFLSQKQSLSEHCVLGQGVLKDPHMKITLMNDVTDIIMHGFYDNFSGPQETNSNCRKMSILK
jgi:hypothetical protein